MQILNLFKNLKMKSLLLLGTYILSCNLILSSVQIKNLLEANLGDKNSERHLSALVESSINKSSVVSKIKKFPGVEKVSFISQEKLKTKIGKALNQLDLKVPQSLVDESYYLLKIYINKTINEQRINLINEYLERTFGKGKITISSIKDAKVVKDNIAIKALGFFELIIFSLALTLSIFFYLFTSSKLNYHMYLIEKFQRRKKHIEIGLFFFFLSMLMASLMPRFYYSNVNILSMALSMAYSLVFLSVIILSYRYYRTKL